MTRKQRAAEAMAPLVGSERPITVGSWEACRAFRHFGCRFTEPVEGLENVGPDVCVRCAADMAWEQVGNQVIHNGRAGL